MGGGGASEVGAVCVCLENSWRTWREEWMEAEEDDGHILYVYQLNYG